MATLTEKQEEKSETLSHVSDAQQDVGKRFNFWTLLGIAVCSSGAWEGWTASIAQGLTGGGPVGLVWGWVFVSVGMACLSLSLAEFVSMWPSAGGQYVWVANLASQRYSRILSWFTAWLGLAGLWLGAISCGMGVSLQIQSYVVLTQPSYQPSTWHAFMGCLVCMMCWVLVNIFAVRAIHYINSFALAVHVFGFFIVIGVLAAFTKEKHNADFVFTAFTNNSGWNSDFVAWSISLLPALYAYMSVDTAIHFCEEVAEPRTVIPRVMILQSITTSLMTFPFIITVVFCLGNVDQILASPIALTSPFTQILINSTGKVGLSCFLNSFSTFVAMTAGFDMWGAASRAIWSMARDNALPPIFAKLHPRWAVSVWANLAMIPPSILVFSIYIWNTTAFYGIMSGVLVAFQLSYLIPIGVNVFSATWSTPLTKGPFQLGRLSWAVHATGFVFGCFAALFMSFPASQPVTTTSMNYAVVIIGFVLLSSLLLWLLYARKNDYGALDSKVIEGATA